MQCNEMAKKVDNQVRSSFFFQTEEQVKNEPSS